jgi:hypothetical protein
VDVNAAMQQSPGGASIQLASRSSFLVVGSDGRGAWRNDLSDVIYGDSVEML